MNLRGAPASALAVVLAICVVLLPHAAHAGGTRPHDAPAVDDPRPPVPDVTSEYGSLEQEGIKLVYHPVARERAHALLNKAVAVRAELGAQLGRPVLGVVEIRIAAAPAQIAALSPIELPGPVTAAAFRDFHLVVMSVASPQSIEPADLEESLRHELAHLALDEAVDRRAIPRWFHEGFAIHVSGEDSTQRAHTLVMAALRDRLLGLRDVEAQFPDGPAGSSIAAAEAADFARFLLQKPNRERFRALIERLRAGDAFTKALGLAYGADEGKVELLWRKEMARRYSFVPVFAGAMLLWMAVAAVMLVRRRRARLARRAIADDLRGAAPLATGRLPLREPRRRDLADDVIEPLPPDHEVPKVEHDGRWHTLH